MSYVYAVRGWLELSWPDADVEGVDESPEEHDAKVRRVRELVATSLTAEALRSESTPAKERYRAGWGFPRDTLDGTEYIFFGADVEELDVVLEIIQDVLKLDPFADGYFSVEGEDGEQFRQWLIKGGRIYTRRQLFPDFEAEGAPAGYVPLSSAS